MADIADIAQDQMEAVAPSLIARSKKPEGPAHTGFCANCGEVTGEKRFCDAECREDWELAQRVALRNGKGGAE